VLCRTEESGSEFPIEEFNWAAGAEFADSMGVDVISSSLGYTRFDDTTLNHSYSQLDGNTTAITRAADVAASKGIVVVNSAGNLGAGNWFYISAPADADSILAVGAVKPDEEATTFSSNGYSADNRVKPDVMALGAVVIVANPSNLDYQAGSGTSFAAPAISGMAACLVQAHPTRSANDIVQAIRASADRYTNPNQKYGYGIPDFQLADLILANISLQDFSTNASPMLYPNPFGGNFSVVHFSDVREAGRIELIDMYGRLINSNDYSIYPGYNQLVVDTTALPKGVYIIRLVTESKSFELKAVRQ
jgi:serine protease AprX